MELNQQQLLNENQGPLPKNYNTTSSIYIRSTIHKPDMKLILKAMAQVINEQMISDYQKTFPRDHILQYFNEEKYIREKPEQFSQDRIALLRQLPEEEHIFEFIYAIYMIAEFSHECCIVGLVYLFRLIRLTKMPLISTTWRPVVFTALLVSQKVIDDVCLKNSDFLQIYPFFDLKECNNLEKRFLQVLNYDLKVGQQLYAKYFFELRTISGVEKDLPKEPLTQQQAINLDIRSKKVGETIKMEVQMQQTKSLDYKPVNSNARAILD